MSVHSDCRYTSRQIHFHDSVYNNCFSLPTDSKGVTNAVAELAEALQAQALGSRHDVDTDRQTCAEMVRKWCKMLRRCLGITSALLTCGRQSTHVEDSLHMWETLYTPGKQSTHLEDSLQASFDERQAHRCSDEALFQLWQEHDGTW
jgi:hypothetical protein